jgi:hypothetical protein
MRKKGLAVREQRKRERLIKKHGRREADRRALQRLIDICERRLKAKI